MFFLIRPLIAKAVGNETNPPILGEIIVGEDQDKNSQIFLLENGQKKQLSESGVPSTDQDTGDRYAVWMSQHEANWQIHAYDLRLDQQFQITFVDNNVSPQTSGEYIIWEGQQQGAWKVFLFDGIQVKSISEGNQPIQNVILEKNLLTFEQKHADGKGWVGWLFDLNTNRLTAISEGAFISQLTLNKGVISWNNADNTQGKLVTDNIRFFPTPTPAPIVIPPTVFEDDEPTPLVPTETIAPLATESAHTTESTSSATPTQTQSPTSSPEISGTPTPIITISPSPTTPEETSASASDSASR